MSIHAVARKAGVSVATVAKVLSGMPVAHDKAARDVRRAIAELGFTPQLQQVQGASGRQGLNKQEIAVISLGAARNWRKRADASAVLKGISAALDQSGLRPRLSDSPDRLLEKKTCQGAIAFVHSTISEPQALALARRLPLVLVMGTRSSRMRIDHIYSSVGQVGRLAFGYLASRRCEQFAFVMDDAHDEATQRLAQAFTRAAVDAGRSVRFHVIARKRPNVAAFADRPLYSNTIRAAIDKIILGEAATGIFSPSPVLAARLCGELEKRRRGDVFLISCDDHNAELASCDPSPAWIDSQWQLIGQTAVKQLVHRIANPGAPAVRVQIPVVLRQST